MAEILEPRLLLAGAVLVKDLNSNPLSSTPSAAINIGSTALFTADDGFHGVELWSTDGTEAGTTLFKDIYPGTPGSQPTFLGVFNNFLYFAAGDGIHGNELWRTNGTAQGTVLFKEISAGSDGASFGNLTIFNGYAYFFVNTSQLWRTDGIAGNTAPIHTSVSNQSMAVTNNSLYFIASTPAAGSELWKTTGGSPTMVADINPGPNSSFVGSLAVLNDQVFFRAFNGTNWTAWKSDGTVTGTQPAGGFPSGSSSGAIEHLFRLNDALVCVCNDDQKRLWRSDGTPDGTFPISDRLQYFASTLTAANGLIFYLATVADHKGLWRTDGTAEGTILLKTVALTEDISTTGWGVVGDTFYFNFTDLSAGSRQFWKSDGTPQGTTFITASLNYLGRPVGQVGAHTLYSLADPRGLELWETDGTDAGTHIIKDINLRTEDSDPKVITNVNDTLFFTTTGGVWKSDGTAAGTVMLKAFPTFPLTTFTDEDDLGVNLNGMFIFTADNQIWRSDGTSQGTFLLKSNLPPYGTELIAANGYALYAGKLANGDVELWRTDGTIQGTVVLMDLPGSINSPSSFTLFNGAVYFTATGNATSALWKTDGTPQGTVQVHASAGYARAAEYKNRLWFSGCDTSGCEPWSTDGNGPGARFTDIYGGTNGSSPNNFVVSNGLLYFTANTPSGRFLYKTDGTVNGNKIIGLTSSNRIIDVNGTLFYSNGSQIVRYNGALGGTLTGPTGTLEEFKSADGLLFLTNNDSLWISDGSTAGTIKVMNHPIGVTGSTTLFLATLNNEVYFRAVDPILGTELFKLSPPTARSNGPYTVGQGNNMTLNASASSDPDPLQTLSYAWDLDNDNIFGETGPAATLGDEVGPTPTYRSANVAVGDYRVSLRITSTSGLSSQLSTTIAVRGPKFIGTPGNDSFRASLVGNHIDFYENAPPGAGPTFSIPLSLVSSILVDAGSGNDSLSLDFRVNLNYTGGAGKDSLILSGGDWVWVGDFAFNGIANLALSNTATMAFNASQHVDSLVLADSSRLKMNPSASFLHTRSLDIQENAALDVADKALILDSGSLADISSHIKTNRITSSSTLTNNHVGAILNGPAGASLYTSFGGESNLSGGEILVRQTLIGDLNLDRTVSIADFIKLSSHFGQTDATWGDGDINFDAQVTIADFIALSANFNQTYSASSAALIPQAALSASTAPPLRRVKHRRHHHHPERRPSIRKTLPRGFCCVLATRWQ